MGRSTVVKLGWRDLLAHRGRSLLAVTGIALGTAVVLSAVASREATANAVGAALTAEVGTADATATPLGASSGLIDDTALDAVRALPEVARAYGTVRLPAKLSGPGGSLAAVTVSAIDETAGDATSSPAEVIEGRPLDGSPGTILLTRTAALTLGVHAGDRVEVEASRRVELIVAGVVSDETSGLASNGRSATVSSSTARELRAAATGWSTIRIELTPGTAAEPWVRANAPRAPAGVLLATADEAVGDLRSISTTVASGIDLLAVSTVFLGCLLCFYVNQVAAAADRRRTALLLVIGATRRDVRLLVLTRSLLVAVVGALAGSVLGFGLARAVTPLVVRLLGFTARSATPPPAAFAVATAAAIAMALTSLAGVPTRRIGAVDALRSADASVAAARSHAVIATSVTVVLFVLALAVKLPGAGGVAVGVGLLLATSWALRDLLLVGGARAAAGAPTAATGTITRPVLTLGARSLGRDARSTGSAMGLLMAAFAVLLATATAHRALEATIDHALARQLGTDLQISFPRPDAPPPPDEVLRVAGVTGQSRLSFGLTTASRDGVDRPLPLSSIDPDTYFTVADFDWRSGDAAGAQAALRAGGATILSEPIARQFGVHTGDDLEVRTATGTTRLRIAGTFVSFLGSAAVVSADDARTLFRLDEPRLVLLTIAPDQVVAAERGLRTRWPDARVVVVRDYRAGARTQLLSLFGIGYATLLVAVGLGACGLAASLSASILRRTEELRLLRSIGATRRDIARMVVLEAVVIVSAGGLLSLPIGLALSRITLDVFEHGLGAELPIVLPLDVLLAIPLAVLPLALLAALAPARRAARVTLVGE